jgi:predicted signal transduction protein with EAL and GGDEF domain
LRYLRVNDAFCAMAGQTREALSELASTGSADGEKRYVRPDGSEVWASVSVVPVREPGGDVDVLFAQMVDITERKAREAELSAQLDEIGGLGEIRRAFAEDRFELHAQPIVDLVTGETVQRELLIRMRAADGSLVPPGDFLPIAEKYGAILDIDRWVIAQGAALWRLPLPQAPAAGLLKIDREFVRDAMSSEGDQHVIRAIVGLAQGFGLQTIGEGVEDAATLELLREFGVDHAQGYHLGRPAPLDTG